MFHSTNIALLAAVAGLSLTACMTTSRTAAGPEYKTENVIGFPTDEDGYGLGVSACYAGRIGDCIIMAGGCNFPEPGKKRYYKGIYAARPDGNRLNWRLVGYLPEAAAYGVTVESGDSLVLAGGCNTNHSLSQSASRHDTLESHPTTTTAPTLHGRQHRRNTVRQQYLRRRRVARRKTLHRHLDDPSQRHLALDQDSVTSRYAKSAAGLRKRRNRGLRMGRIFTGWRKQHSTLRRMAV